MKSKLQDGDPRHGTENGYGNLACRCNDCRTAHAVYTQEVKSKRALNGPDDPRHGTENGYGNYNCRCAACTEIWSRESTLRKRRREARGGA